MNLLENKKVIAVRFFLTAYRKGNGPKRSFQHKGLASEDTDRRINLVVILMASFRGTYTSTVVKGRVKLPKRLRDVLGTFPDGRFVIGYSPDGCLAIFSEADHEKEERRLNRLDYQLSDHRRIQREFMRRFKDIGFDQQGRCTISQDFLDEAQIKEEVVIFGAGKRLEFWDPEVYQKFNLQKEGEEPYEQVVENNFRRKV